MVPLDPIMNESFCAPCHCLSYFISLPLGIFPQYFKVPFINSSMVIPVLTVRDEGGLLGLGVGGPGRPGHQRSEPLEPLEPCGGLLKLRGKRVHMTRPLSPSQ